MLQSLLLKPQSRSAARLQTQTTSLYQPLPSSRLWFSSSMGSSSKDEKGTNEEASAVEKDGKDDSIITPPESTTVDNIENVDDLTKKFTVPVEIRMPDMSAGHENTVEEWFKKPGDIIKYNDVLCDIATQDFTFGLSMDDDHDALMGEIHVEAGAKAPDGTPICTVYHPPNSTKEKKH
jgi:Biotin-requiring enzyme